MRLDGQGPGDAALVVSVAAVVLTATFIGLVALVTGEAVKLFERLPVYVLVGAASFVGAVVWIEETWPHLGRALPTAAAVGAVVSVTLGLGTEGLLFALNKPGKVIGSHLLTYLLAAGLIGAGLSYWSWRNRGILRATGIGDHL